MKIYLTDQKHKFKEHLDYFKTKSIMPYDKTRLKEKITTIDINTAKKIDQLNLDFLFDYQIFPANTMTFQTEWAVENRKMRTNDTITQQVFIPPIKMLSQKIIFGVRIKEIINQENKKGFSYETLEGHVEKGISTFTIEQADDKIIFKIHTFSLPGNSLTKLLGPIISVPYQTFCTKAALKHVKRQLEIE